MKMVDYLRPRLFEPLWHPESFLGELPGRDYERRLGPLPVPGGRGQARGDVRERRKIRRKTDRPGGMCMARSSISLLSVASSGMPGRLIIPHPRRG